MITRPTLASSRDLDALLSSASVEVSSRGHQLADCAIISRRAPT